jgi:hypothetical protein
MPEVEPVTRATRSGIRIPSPVFGGGGAVIRDGGVMNYDLQTHDPSVSVRR